MIILNSILPVFSLIILGSILKRARFINVNFLDISDKLIYFIFFPVMLFWKIGGSSINAVLNFNFVYATLCSILVISMGSTIYALLFKINKFDIGSFVQSCFRFNTYIGFAVIINAIGEEGILVFGIIISFAIPLINILSVSLLTWFSESTNKHKKKWANLMASIIKNPLIIACIAGLLFSNLNLKFPDFLNNLFQLMATASLPLALISIGGSFTFAKLKDYGHLSIVGAFFKLIIFPLIGFGFLSFFNVTGVAFNTTLIFCSLPTATSIYVLSSQLNSNKELAASSIVTSTVFSFFTLSTIMLYIF